MHGFRPSSGFDNPLRRFEKLVAEGFELEQPVSRLDIPSVETMLKYQGYLKRQESDVQRRSRDEHRRIPRAFRYAGSPRPVVGSHSTPRPSQTRNHRPGDASARRDAGRHQRSLHLRFAVELKYPDSVSIPRKARQARFQGRSNVACRRLSTACTHILSSCGNGIARFP